MPGVGPRIERGPQQIGVHCLADLVGRDPEELYRPDGLRKGFQEDRCALYVDRLAVYCAENPVREAEKLKWWYWKNIACPPKGENGK